MKSLYFLSVLLALALGGCVPIPMAQTAYVPDKADATPVTTRSGCAFNEHDTGGYRQVGNATVYFTLMSPDRRSPAARARLNLVVRQPKGRSLGVSVDPLRISLLEEGRTKTAGLDTFVGGTSSRALLFFPPPSGLASTVIVRFETGAIRIGGRAVPFAPIRFNRKAGPVIYMFPCIPS